MRGAATCRLKKPKPNSRALEEVWEWRRQVEKNYDAIINRTKTITHESEKQAIQFAIGPNEIVCLCFELIDGSKPARSVVKIEARHYSYPDDFRVLLHIPYLSKRPNVPNECDGEPAKIGKLWESDRVSDPASQ